MFERDTRYLVLKYTDIHKLSNYFQNQLFDVVEQVCEIRANAGKPTLNCVVVEDDWPEYEKVWEMIETRCNNKVNNAIS